MNPLRTLDRYLAPRQPWVALAAAVAGVAIVGVIDYVVGFEISVSLLYLAPVAMAAWYSGRGGGLVAALLSCLAWLLADRAAGYSYSHGAIAAWNGLVRFGVFAVVALLVNVYRNALEAQRLLVRTDALTGLATRRAFSETLAHDLAMAARRRSPLSVVYLDLDGFKAVNDSRGHAEGDRVLRAVAHALRTSLRDTDSVTRLGGDEFAVALPDTDAEGAAIVAEGLARALRREFEAGGWPVACSMGVVTFVGGRTGVAAALEEADRAMYEAKRAGRGRIVRRTREGQTG